MISGNPLGILVSKSIECTELDWSHSSHLQERLGRSLYLHIPKSILPGAKDCQSVGYSRRIPPLGPECSTRTRRAPKNCNRVPGKTIAVRVVWTAGLVEWKLEGFFGLLHYGKFKICGESGEKLPSPPFPCEPNSLKT